MTDANAEADDTICIVGLGYVGLPLAIEFDRIDGHAVIGYDIDEAKVDALADGRDPTGEVGEEIISASDVQFTSDPTPISDADFVILTVPTPVDDIGNPNTDFIEEAGRTVGRNMTADTVVILESTVYPGATGMVLIPALEESSGMRVGEEFEVGYSPERASPGDTGRSVTDVVKIVSARTDEVRERVADLYGRIVEAGIYEAPNIQTAEAAKAIENIQRDINIALVNELAIACDHMGLETHEVLDAARTKWNFHEGYRPGLVGGHCIPVDPLFLAHRSEREGFSPKLILQAREINEYMPKHTADLTIRALNECGKVLKESSLLMLGVAYKPNVPDIRTSEVSGLITELSKFGVDVTAHDPHAETEAVREEFGVDVIDGVTFEGFDGILLATPHDEYLDLDLEAAAAALADDPVLIDVSGVVDQERAEEHGFAYRRL